MVEPNLTEQERASFYPDITRNRALDYFFVFDNAPLQFIYRDKLIPGELSDLEKRNKSISETLWIEAYHQYLLSNAVYLYFYRGPVLQTVFQVHQFGAGTFTPPPVETRTFVPTAEGVRANFDSFMTDRGWKAADEMRKQPARGSWASLLGTPDRTVRIASIMPVGNQVVLELISTWTEDGTLKEAAWVAVLIYDTDGTVLQDRSYIDMANWPSARRYAQMGARTPQNRPQDIGIGVLDRFFAYHKSKMIEPATLTDLEKRNLAIIEGPWVEAFNTNLGHDVYHQERCRVQLPVQKCSYSMKVGKEVDAIVAEAAPDRKLRLALTYAKGSQVAAEGIVSWTENGMAREAPIISFILLDDAGKVIRDRRYITMGNWPGAATMAARLGT